MSQDLLQQWKEYKKLVEEVEVDVVKGTSGNASARLRARKSFRVLSKHASKLCKMLLEMDKSKKEEPPVKEVKKEVKKENKK